MFDIGFSELFVIAIVALLVLGPERLPKAARFAGLWVRRARAQWYSVKADLENELADDELKRNLQQARDQLQGEMRDLRDGLQQRAQAVQDDFTLPATAQSPAPAANVMPPAPADARTPDRTVSSRSTTGDAAADGDLADGSHPAARMATESVATENVAIENGGIDRRANPPAPSDGVPVEARPHAPPPGGTASADGIDPDSPRGARPAGPYRPANDVPGESHDEQR